MERLSAPAFHLLQSQVVTGFNLGVTPGANRDTGAWAADPQRFLRERHPAEQEQEHRAASRDFFFKKKHPKGCGFGTAVLWDLWVLGGKCFQQNSVQELF